MFCLKCSVLSFNKGWMVRIHTGQVRQSCSSRHYCPSGWCGIASAVHIRCHYNKCITHFLLLPSDYCCYTQIQLFLCLQMGLKCVYLTWTERSWTRDHQNNQPSSPSDVFKVCDGGWKRVRVRGRRAKKRQKEKRYWEGNLIPGCPDRQRSLPGCTFCTESRN